MGRCVQFWLVPYVAKSDHFFDSSWSAHGLTGSAAFEFTLEHITITHNPVVYFVFTPQTNRTRVWLEANWDPAEFDSVFTHTWIFVWTTLNKTWSPSMEPENAAWWWILPSYLLISYVMVVYTKHVWTWTLEFESLCPPCWRQTYSDSLLHQNPLPDLIIWQIPKFRQMNKLLLSSYNFDLKSW